MNILVTGATGFIGRHLVRNLSRHTEYTIFGLTRNLKRISPPVSSNIQYLQGDITCRESLDVLAHRNFDIVFHCAACVENAPKEALYRTNVLGTKNICECALRARVSRLVYTSSVAVISGNDRAPFTEDMPYRATNPYGDSKIAAEKIVWDYREKGVPAAIVRPPMVYGADEPHMLGILLTLLRLRMLPFLNDGAQAFHLAYVENVVAALTLAATHEGFLEGTYFVADEDVLSYKEVVTFLCEGLGVKVPGRLPRMFDGLVDAVPCMKKKKDRLLRPRQYCLDRIHALGFKAPYAAKESLILSARNFTGRAS
ncbi:MAG: NAD(P)-dependent oxidoreductase [Candidatus Omnitrophica bacterium]|nr:NAD(P)-dependent oxidoreductase [Candidatus Omnitrophota bacterium]